MFDLYLFVPLLTLAAAAVCVRRGDWMPWLFVILLTTPIGPIVYLVVVFATLPTTSSLLRRSPSAKLMLYSLPSRRIQTSRFFDSALTTETPTPCKPPENW